MNIIEAVKFALMVLGAVILGAFVVYYALQFAILFIYAIFDAVRKK